MPKADTQFKKGQSGNPGGKQRIPDDLKKVQALSKEMVARIIGKYSLMTTEDLTKLEKDKTLPAIDMVIVVALKKAIENGYLSTLGFLFDRAIGKVSDNIEANLNVKAIPVTKENLAELYAAASKL